MRGLSFYFNKLFIASPSASRLWICGINTSRTPSVLHLCYTLLDHIFITQSLPYSTKPSLIKGSEIVLPLWRVICACSCCSTGRGTIDGFTTNRCSSRRSHKRWNGRLEGNLHFRDWGLVLAFCIVYIEGKYNVLLDIALDTSSLRTVLPLDPFGTRFEFYTLNSI